VTGRQCTRAIFQVWPVLADKTPFADLGQFPTPVTRLDDVAHAVGAPSVELYDKRDDLTSPIYGGNKVRTIEVLFGHALANGYTHVYSTGAYGSNHAAAAAMHAPRVGLVAGAMLYPQPWSRSAADNLELLLSRSPRPPLRDLPHWAALPYGLLSQAVALHARGERGYVMVPGGAIPLGALGYVSAGLELAQQVADGVLPAPRAVVVPIGSNCTSAGLLVGLALAAKLGIGLDTPPRLVAVRVTPWPVTSTLRIVGLATRTSRLLARLVGDATVALTMAELRQHLHLETRFIGSGYGFATDDGKEAARIWSQCAGHGLETTYSGKAAAAVLAMLKDGHRGPILYWSTKSSAPLVPAEPSQLAWAPRRMRRWMSKARQMPSDA